MWQPLRCQGNDDCKADMCSVCKRTNTHVDPAANLFVTTKNKSPAKDPLVKQATIKVFADVESCSVTFDFPLC